MKSRYARQVRLPEIGPEGQSRIRGGGVLVVGVGGLGCPAALYLAAAGVGRIGLVDDDRVDLTNLQRQILFETSEEGLFKVEAARIRLKALNPDVEVIVYRERLTRSNAETLMAPYDVVVDGTDNFATKFLLNDTAVRLRKPLVFGTVSGFEGQASVFRMPEGPCYRCLYPQPPRTAIPNCAEAGVLGALAGMVGSLQALEALKLLALSPDLEPLVGRLWTMDAATLETRVLQLKKRPDCPVCAPGVLGDFADTVETEPECAAISQEPMEMTAEELLLAPREELLLIDVREPHEFASAHIPGAVNLPVSQLSNLDARPLEGLPRDRVIILYCHAGVRSEWALELFRSQGFHLARHLRGGILAWTGPVTS